MTRLLPPKPSGRLAQRGYTLIELAVVLSTVGLLVIIVGVSARSVLSDSSDRQAEASLQQVLLAEQDFAQRFGAFTAYTPDLDRLDGPEVTNAPSDSAEQVSVAVSVDGSLGLAVRRSDDECLLLEVKSMDAGGAISRRDSPVSACVATAALSGVEDLDARNVSRAA